MRDLVERGTTRQSHPDNLIEEVDAQEQEEMHIGADNLKSILKDMERELLDTLRKVNKQKAENVEMKRLKLVEDSKTDYGQLKKTNQ